MSEMHDQDDLPPKNDRQHNPTLGFTIGEVSGSLVWLVIILALAAVVAWLAIRWMG
jgi:hypothetical protein